MSVTKYFHQAGSGSCGDSGVCNIKGCCPFEAPVLCMTQEVPRDGGFCCSGDFPICVSNGCQAGNGELTAGVPLLAKLAAVMQADNATVAL